MEYNKSIEAFIMHYRPSHQDIFSIFLQVSRFMKEFSDFENENTPEFRHPPIVGGAEMAKIGLYPEIDILGIFWGEIVLKGQKKKIWKTVRPKILSQIEQVRIDVPGGRQIVREHYKKLVEGEGAPGVVSAQAQSNEYEIEEREARFLEYGKTKEEFGSFYEDTGGKDPSDPM